LDWPRPGGLAPPRAARASIRAAFEASGRQDCHVVALDMQPIKFELVINLKTAKVARLQLWDT
jgi:hypothetical protein